LSAFSPSAREARSASCRDCINARQRTRDAGSDLAEFSATVRRAPDPAPAIRLRVELLAARTIGMSFTDAFAVAVLTATAGMRRWERDQWTEVFQWARPWWRAAYLFEEDRAPCRLVDSLLD
jgi:hypothetical protein